MKRRFTIVMELIDDEIWEPKESNESSADAMKDFIIDSISGVLNMSIEKLEVTCERVKK